MTEIAGSVAVQIKAALEPFEQGLAKANQEAQQFDQRASKSFRNVDAAAAAMGKKAADAGKQIAAANDNAGRSVEKLGGVYAKVAGLIAGLFGTAIAAFSLDKFIQATTDSDRAQTQLAATLRSTGGAAGKSVDDLNAYAASLQKATNFEDDAVTGAQALLLTFTRIRGDTFDRATSAILDMSQALGQDLKSSAIQLGKALNDPIQGVTALQRVGVSFSKSQKDVIKNLAETGKVAQAQGIILHEIETEFGGAAKAARDTLGGALKSLGNTWGNLFELGKNASEPLRQAIEALITAMDDPGFISFVQTIGTALFGAFTLAVKGATLLVEGISALANNLDVIAVAAATLGTTLAVAFGPAILSGIVAGFAAIGSAGITAIGAITAAMAANPLGALIVGITVAVTAIYAFRDEIRQAFGVDVVQIFKDTVNAIVGAFVGAFLAIKASWKLLPAALGDVVITTVNGVIKSVEGMVQKVIDGLNNLLNKYALWRANIGQPLDPKTFNNMILPPVKFDTLPNKYEGAASNAIGAAKSGFAEGQADYVGELGEIFSGSKSATDATNDLTTALKATGAAMDDIGGGGGKGKKQKEDPYAKIVRGAHQFIESQELERNSIGMTEEATNSLRYEQELLNQAANAHIKLLPEQKQQLHDLATEMAATEEETKKAQEAFEFTKDTTKSFFSDLKQGLENGEGLWKSFGNAALNVLNKIVDKLLNDVLDAFFQVSSAGSSGGGGFLSGLLGLFGGSSKGFDLGAGATAFKGTQPFAKGGAFTNSIVNSPTLFRFANGTGLMGEAGPEAIMPLRRDSSGRLGVSMHGGQQGANQNDVSSSASAIKVDVGVQVSVDQNGNLKAYVKNVAQTEAKGAVGQYDRQVLPSRVNQINKDPRAR